MQTMSTQKHLKRIAANQFIAEARAELDNDGSLLWARELLDAALMLERKGLSKIEREWLNGMLEELV